jgi:hypothetical protein
MWKAIDDGRLDNTERQTQLIAALGVDTIEDAFDEIARIAQETGLDVGLISDYITRGVDPSGQVAAALEKSAKYAELVRKNQELGQQTAPAEVLAAQRIADARERQVAAAKKAQEYASLDDQISMEESALRQAQYAERNADAAERNARAWETAKAAVNAGNWDAYANALQRAGTPAGIARNEALEARNNRRPG